jgi:hypothetical protein
MSEVATALRGLGEAFQALTEAVAREVEGRVETPKPEPEPEPKPEAKEAKVPTGDALRAKFRDWFTKREMPWTRQEAAHNLGVHVGTAHHLIRWAMERGIVVQDGFEKGGRGRPSKLYRYVPAKEAKGPKSRREHALRNGRLVDEPSGLSRGGQVAGSGPSLSSLSPNRDVRELLKSARSHGLTIRRGGSGHIQVLQDERFVTTIPATPTDHRGLKNARAKIKRETGIAV